MMKSSCDSDFDPASIAVEEALKRIDDVVNVKQDIVRVMLSDAQHRVLAQDIAAPFDVPNHDNSAMDGYAIRFADLEHSSSFNVVGKSFAGSAFEGVCHKGEAIRIMTGAIMPKGCDTVVMQENVIQKDNESEVEVTKAPKAATDNVRYAGESLKKDDVALEKGRWINASDMGLLASLGIAHIDAYQKPKIAILTTGDEIKSVGSPLNMGEVYDSNRYTLMAMLDRFPCQIIDLGIIKDDAKLTEKTLSDAAKNYDAIIVSGGASVGEADYVRHALKKLGQVSFWKLAMRPGRPLSFGKIGDCLFFGLPGNPVSVMVTFYQFVQPAIQKLMGIKNAQTQLFKVKCTQDLRKRPGRVEYQRGILFKDEHGELMVKGTGDQGSGILSTMSRANCFMVLPNESAGTKAGEFVEVQPFHGLMAN